MICACDLGMDYSDSVFLAIKCITYNHEPYIRQCLDGFVMQKTNFRFVAIVHDDASTDKTADIIREYELKYPDVIKPIYETENQYSRHDGSVSRIVDAAAKATGAKYIAICEGDDYWTDPYKLQKQVDFLETHEEYSMCCHRFSIFEQNNGEIHGDWLAECFADGTDCFTFSNYENMRIWIAQTLTIMYRNQIPSDPNHGKYKCYCDIHFNYHFLHCGKGACLSFNGAVYRRHDDGVDSPFSMQERKKISIKKYGDLFQFNNDDPELRKYYWNDLNCYCSEYVMKPIEQGTRVASVWNDFVFVKSMYRKYFGFKSEFACFKKCAHSCLRRITKSLKE